MVKTSAVVFASGVSTRFFWWWLPCGHIRQKPFLANAPDGPLVDGDGGVGGGFAVNSCVAGDGALRVLVEGIGRVGRDERIALLVVVRCRGAVADGVVGVVVVEAADGRVG